MSPSKQTVRNRGGRRDPYKRGRSWRGEHLVLWRAFSPETCAVTDWKIILSRKLLRRATQRNWWKRRIREALRRRRGGIRPGYEAVLKLCVPDPKPSYAELEKEIMQLLKLSGLWYE